MDYIDFLPSTISPNLKLVILGLLGAHLLAFIVWMSLFCKSLGKKEESFEKQVESMIKNSKKNK